MGQVQCDLVEIPEFGIIITSNYFKKSAKTFFSIPKSE